MSDSINITLTISEANLLLEALGNIPYFRVYELISKIQNLAQEQLNGMSSAHRENNGAQQPAVKAASSV